MTPPVLLLWQNPPLTILADPTTIEPLASIIKVEVMQGDEHRREQQVAARSLDAEIMRKHS